MLSVSYYCIFLAIKKQVRESLENSWSLLTLHKSKLTVIHQSSYKVGVGFFVHATQDVLTFKFVNAKTETFLSGWMSVRMDAMHQVMF